MLSFSSSHWQRDAQHASTPSPPPCSAAHSPHLWMFAFRIHRNTRHTPPLVDWRALCRDHGLSQQRPHFQVLKPKGSCDQGMVSRSQGLTTDDLSRSPPEHVEGPSSQPPWWPQELPPRCISAPPPEPRLSLLPTCCSFFPGPRASTPLAAASGFLGVPQGRSPRNPHSCPVYTFPRASSSVPVRRSLPVEASLSKAVRFEQVPGKRTSR